MKTESLNTNGSFPLLANKKELFLLFVIVFVSRLPFIFAGYGVEEDSWGIALAAFHTHLSRIYEPSRFPGHPVQELIYSALWGSGPVVFNGLSALFSSIAAVFFALILKHFQFKQFFIASLAFAFVPVYYISSTYTIDFVWTETFILISLYCLLQGRFMLCGIFLGLAIGCRITSGAMILPFMIIVWQQDNFKQNFVTLLKISLPMALFILLAFIPLIQQFGFSFLMYYDQFPYPPIAKVFYKMSLGVFGLIGMTAIGMGILWLISNRDKNPSSEIKLDKKIIFASLLIIVLYSISYFRLPQKSGYMMPVIPFVILLFGNYLTPKKFILICWAFILSPFIMGINLTDKLRGAEYSKFAVTFKISGQDVFFDPFTGPVFADYSKRKQKIKYTENVIKKLDSIQSKTVIIAGWWFNEIMVTIIPIKKNKLVIIEPYIDSTKINKYLADGYEIFYLPEQNIYNDQLFKMNVTDSLSKPFINLTQPKSQPKPDR